MEIDARNVDYHVLRAAGDRRLAGLQRPRAAGFVPHPTVEGWVRSGLQLEPRYPALRLREPRAITQDSVRLVSDVSGLFFSIF